MSKILQIDVLTGVFKLLSDETRLRILSVLSSGELAVGELQKILGLGQSTLSTQLGLLKEQDLVASRKEGQKVFYRIPGTPKDDPRLVILASALDSAIAAKWHDRDTRNLRKVLEERSEKSREFFNSLAVQNLPAPGQTWKALSNGLIRLIRGQRIVDLGCGNGRLSLLLAEAGNTVTGVDNSEEQIRLAKDSQAKTYKPFSPGNPAATSGQDAGAGALSYAHAPMEATGLPASSFDIVILSQSLHHASNPRQAIAESYRLLARGGRILILDLLSHDEEWMRQKFGDFWLGFSREDLEAWLSEAGFVRIHAEITGSSEDYPEIEGVLMQGEKG